MKTLDPITLEVLRSRLEAIGEEAGAALGRVSRMRERALEALAGPARVVEHGGG